MSLSTELKNNDIKIEELQKSLKLIGLNLSRFESVTEEKLPVLIELFKIALEINPKSSTRLAKMDLRSKFEKVLKGNKFDLQSNPQSNLFEERAVSKQHHVSHNLNLGKVKFFDHKVNNFGIVVGVSDNIECHVSPINILTPIINDDDIVIYEPIKNHNGRFRAINVSRNIPVFIFNKDSSPKSFAFPLIENQLEKEINLTEKFETGFTFLNAKYYRTSIWRSTVLTSGDIGKTEIIFFGKIILSKLLSNLNDYKGAIEWLTSLLQTELSEEELSIIYRDIIKNFEQKTVSEINNEINFFNDNPFLITYLDRNKKSLNKMKSNRLSLRLYSLR
jgi:hypothetical protein